MVVAVIAVRVVQVSVDEVVDVIAVRDRFVITARPVLMLGGVPSAVVTWRTAVGVLICHPDGVAFYAIRAIVVEFAVMKMVDMITVADSGVPAAGSVLMGMRTHGCLLLRVSVAPGRGRAATD